MKRVICLVICSTAAIARADWKPPADFDPDLEKIVHEARADVAAGKYEEAYQIGVWFSLHAYRHNPAQETTDWTNYVKTLPDLGQLKAARDEAFQNLREGKSRGPVFIEFSTFSGINQTLGEEKRTEEFIVWLDANRPEVLKADHVFDLIMPTLIKFKEYHLCGKYLAPGDAYWQNQILKGYQELLRSAEAHDGIGRRPHLQIYAEKQFGSRTASLIALLVINERKAEAATISSTAEKVLGDAAFKKQIEQSLNGEMPQPWP
jgi:hypothetical protein